MKITRATVLLTVLSIAGAGWIGQLRKEPDQFARAAEIGQVVPLDGGQTLAVTAVRYGQFAVSERYPGNSLISKDRIVSVRFKAATPREQVLTMLRCTLRDSRDVVTEPVKDYTIFPETGFRTQFTLIFEMSRTTAVGARVHCTTGAVLRYQEPAVDVDLGISEKNLDEVWDRSRYQRVPWETEKTTVVGR